MKENSKPVAENKRNGGADISKMAKACENEAKAINGNGGESASVMLKAARKYQRCRNRAKSITLLARKRRHQNSEENESRKWRSINAAEKNDGEENQSQLYQLISLNSEAKSGENEEIGERHHQKYQAISIIKARRRSKAGV